MKGWNDQPDGTKFNEWYGAVPANVARWISKSNIPPASFDMAVGDCGSVEALSAHLTAGKPISRWWT